MNCIVTRNPSLYIFSIILFLMGDNVQKKWKQGNVIHRKLLMCLFARRKKEFRNTHLFGVDSGLISLSGNTERQGSSTVQEVRVYIILLIIHS